MRSKRKLTSGEVVCYGVVLISALCVVCDGAQSFREAPQDTEVIRGQTAILKCRVTDMKGDLQWTKGGFAMGHDRSLPGYSRYTVIGNEDIGEADLMISNVQLADDAAYECQVGPGGGDPPLLAAADLNVLIPPEQPSIDEFSNGSVLEVPHEQENLTMTCVSKSGKPAATITWERNGEPISEGIDYTIEDVGDKLQNAMSALTIQPQGEDNGAYFKCTAQNGALKQALETTVMLSVMHPPGIPEITGYENGQVVKTGDTLKLLCISEGGNPLAQVYWYKNGKELDFSHITGGNKAENELVITVQPSDSEAVYRCEASNRVTPQPLAAEVKLTVQFGPATVSISGHQHAKAGDTVMLSCESEISNPPAVITWFSRGHQLEGATSEVEPSPMGGYVTVSNISVTLTDRENNVIYQCHGTNEVLGQTVDDIVTLTVMYPPEQPTISGYTEGVEVAAKKILSLTCTSVGGNPLATLTWWKGDTQIEGAIRTTGKIVSNQISFILKPDDNQAKYTCNATNLATETPLLSAIKLSVNFPPKNLDITTEPEKPKAGSKLTITCKSSSSNPASVLSWWKDGREIQGLDGGVVPSDYGGKSTVSRLELIPTADDDEQIYACRATNRLLERAVSDAVTLNVLYKPAFPSDAPATVDIQEGQAAVVNLTIRANPDDTTYSWFKEGKKIKFGNSRRRRRREMNIPHFTVDGGVLYMVNVTREDSGSYTCKAKNGEGETQHSFSLNVQYGAEISKITQSAMVDADAEATFECEARANPVIPNMILWMRNGYDMAKVVQSYVNGKSVMTITNVTKVDTGVFTCQANNSIGDPASATASLIVKYAPEVDKSQALGRAAAEKGNIGKLICKAEGAPAVVFKWYKGGTELDTTSAKYKAEHKKVNIVHYESTLSVFNVTKEDYAQYQCSAKNELGEDSRSISLDGTSKPEAPYNIRFVNSTHDSITISWMPGFDGGLMQHFQVRYVKVGDIAHIYADVKEYTNVYTVTGLSLATRYQLTVRAINSLGESPFQQRYIRASTSAVAPLSEADLADDVPLIIILTVSIIGMILLGLNVLLILFFIRRRRKRMEKADASESASQANTLEMFSAPTITEDSKSYTTYDRSLEDFTDPLYDYRNYGVKRFPEEDEMKRFLPPPSYMGYPPPEPYPVKGPPPPGGLYPPPRGDITPSPGLDQQRSFLIGKGSREPIYLDDKSAHPQGWEPRKEPYGSLKRPPPAPMDEDAQYAEELRKLQKSLGSTGTLDSRPPGREPQKPMPMSGPDSRPPGRAPPPPPPARSTSRTPVEAGKNLPPLPSRNYAPDEIPRSGPRYGPPPGSAYQSPSGLNKPPPPPPTSSHRPPPPDVRGHLV